MTIKFLAPYGKWPANSIVTLDSATEAALVAGKNATTDTAGGVVYSEALPVYRDLNPSQAAALQAQFAPTGYLATPHGVQVDFANTASLSDVAWVGATGTLTLTREVTYEGRPTLRVDMPAACTRVDVGVASGLALPAGWDTGSARNFGIAMCVQDVSLHNLFQLFVGDATYTNYDLLSANIRATQGWNGWRIVNYRGGVAGELQATNGGASTVLGANVSRAKIRIQKDVAQAGVVYLAWAGTMPKEKTKILWTADDGYDEWYSWLMPAATLHGIPWALGFDPYYTKNNPGNNFMTEAQVRAMAADSTGLFELYSHGYNNLGVTDVGAAAYLANDDATWSWLKSLGVRNERVYHPFVKGQTNSDAITGMKARGLRVCRLAENQGTNGRTVKTSISHVLRPDGNLQMLFGFSLEATYNLAAGKAAIDAAIDSGGTLPIMCHEFVDAAPAGLQWLKTDTLALMEYAAAKERAGLLENVKASSLAANLLAVIA